MRTSPDLRPFRPYVSVVLCAAMVLSLFVGMITFPAPASAAEPVTVVLQDGLNGYAGTKSAHVSKGSPDTTFGTQPGVVLAKKSTSEFRAFLQFEDFSSIPRYADITGASLGLSMLSFPSDTENAASVGVYKVTQEWDETDIIWNNSVTDENRIYDLEPVTTQEKVGLGGKAINTWAEIDLTELTRQWVNGSVELRVHAASRINGGLAKNFSF